MRRAERIRTKRLAPFSLLLPPHGMMLVAAVKYVSSAKWIYSRQMITQRLSFRRCDGTAQTADICLYFVVETDCLPLRLNFYWTFLQRTFMSLINIQHANRHSICPSVINITIHFDIGQAARRPYWPSRVAAFIKQWSKWFCEAGGGSPDEARLEQTPYPFQPN